MVLDECEMCHGLRCHAMLKRNMNTCVQNRLKDMRVELQRVQRHLHKAYWYQFELTCKNWKEPWHESLLDSQIAMPNNVLGYWFIGSIADAPKLPVAILEIELRECRRAVAALEEASTAATDWAPGGQKYERLLRSSTMVELYDSWHTKSKQEVVKHVAPAANTSSSSTVLG